MFSLLLVLLYLILIKAPKLNLFCPFPYHLPHSIVMMDNCWIYYNKVIQQIIEAECGIFSIDRLILFN